MGEESVFIYGRIQLLITVISLVLVTTLKTVKNPRLVTNCTSLLPLSFSPSSGFGELVGLVYNYNVIYFLENFNELKEG